MFGVTRAIGIRATGVWEGQLDDHAIGAAWSPDGSRLAAAAVGGPVAIFDATSGHRMATIPGHNFGTTSLSWRFDGGAIATGGQDGTVRIWEPESAGLLHALDAGAGWVEAVAFATHRDWLVSAAGRKLRLWNSKGELVTDYAPHPSTISDVAWQIGEPYFTTAAYGQLAIFRPGEPQPYKKFEWKGSILRVVWSPDSNYVATGNQDASVHFWYRRSGKDLEMSGYSAKVRELAWDATSRYLATGGSPVVTVWDCGGKGPAGTRPIQLDGHNALPTALAYQHKGPLLASGCRTGRVCLWSPAKGEDLLFSATLDGEITRLSWSPDDRLLAAATSEGAIRVYKLS
jgi:WD40 repeat protein